MDGGQAMAPRATVFADRPARLTKARGLRERREPAQRSFPWAGRWVSVARPIVHTFIGPPRGAEKHLLQGGCVTRPLSGHNHARLIRIAVDETLEKRRGRRVITAFRDDDVPHRPVRLDCAIDHTLSRSS